MKSPKTHPERKSDVYVYRINTKDRDPWIRFLETETQLTHVSLIDIAMSLFLEAVRVWSIEADILVKTDYGKELLKLDVVELIPKLIKEQDRDVRRQHALIYFYQYGLAPPPKYAKHILMKGAVMTVTEILIGKEIEDFTMSD
jgi:hypothetical protein